MKIPERLREDVRLAIIETGLLGSIGAFSTAADVAAIAVWWGYLLVKFTNYYCQRSLTKEEAKKICTTALLGMGGYYAGCKTATKLFHLIPGAGTLLACGVSSLTNMVFTYRFALTLTKVFESGTVDFATLSNSILTMFAGTGSGLSNIKDMVELFYKKEEFIESRVKQGILWTLDKEGLLTIMGSGKMPDWDMHPEGADTPWYARRDEIKKVTIAEGFTNIGNYAFCYCNNLTEVHIPDTVTSIGTAAFRRCARLAGIRIPNSVVSIGDQAFSCCRYLSHIHLPKSVISIGSEVFSECKNLNVAYIPKSVEHMGTKVFTGCEYLYNVKMPACFDTPFFKMRYGISRDIVTFI